MGRVKKRVLLGFSGGIDSTAAALSLQEEGYDVTLLTLDTLGKSQDDPQIHRTAQALGLPLRIEAVHERFRQEIVDPFIADYLHGETPAPCTRCNTRIKWKTLFEIAEREGYDHIATGHYFRIYREHTLCYVRQACDPIKDQSYYLWDLPQEYLQRAVTPMGERIKREVRGTLPETLRPRESMGVCFLEGERYADFIRQRVPGVVPGDIVTSTGEIIGEHEGCALYTIGQKRGLSTRLDIPLVVTAIDALRNRIVVGSDEELCHRHLLVREFRVPDLYYLTTSSTVSVKIRGIGRNPDGFARIRIGEDQLHVELDQPAWAAAKGQPVVFYDGDRVVGGGILSGYF